MKRYVIGWAIAGLVLIMGGCAAAGTKPFDEAAGTEAAVDSEDGAVPGGEAASGGEAVSAGEAALPNPEDRAEGTALPEAKVPGGVPYFKDAFMTDIAADENYLYTYLAGRICRYNKKYSYEQVLYRACNTIQDGNFILYDQWIYFIETSYLNRLGQTDGAYGTSLCRINKDGSEPIVLLDDLSEISFEIEIYDQILYLYSYGERRQYELDRDGRPGKQLTEKETLYRYLPSGYTELEGLAGRFSNKKTCTVPYSIRNYGYLLARNDQGTVVKLDPEGEWVIETPLIREHQIEMITHQYIFSTSYKTVQEGNCESLEKQYWITDLDTLALRAIPGDDGEYVDDEGFIRGYDGYIFDYDEEGYYTITQNQEDWQTAVVIKRNWDGEMINKFSFINAAGAYMFYDNPYGNVNNILAVREGYLYFLNRKDGEEYLVRLKMEPAAEFEEITRYTPGYTTAIGKKERFDEHWVYDEGEVRLLSWNVEIEQYIFNEDTAAKEKINRQLAGITKTYLDEARQDFEEMKDPLYGITLYDRGSGMYGEMTVSVNCDFLNDRFVSIGYYQYDYVSMAAHGNHDCEDYVFDLQTGARVGLLDLVENPREEAAAIIGEYFAASDLYNKIPAADLEAPKEHIIETCLEPGRFSLNEEGIGITYDHYELADYASGPQSIWIPYAAFTMKEPMHWGYYGMIAGYGEEGAMEIDYHRCYPLYRDGGWGIINGYGEILVEPEYCFSTVLANDLYFLSADPVNLTTGKIYQNDGTRMMPELGDLTIFGGGPDGDTPHIVTDVFLYEKNGLKGLVRYDGAKLTAAKYEEVCSDYNGEFFVTLSAGKYGIATAAGELTPPIYDGIYGGTDYEIPAWPDLLGSGDPQAQIRYTVGWIDGKEVICRGAQPVGQQGGNGDIAQIQGMFFRRGERLTLLDENLTPYYTFPEGVDYDSNYYGPEGECSLGGLIPLIKDGMHGAADKTGRLLIPFGEYKMDYDPERNQIYILGSGASFDEREYLELDLPAGRDKKSYHLLYEDMCGDLSATFGAVGLNGYKIYSGGWNMCVTDEGEQPHLDELNYLLDSTFLYW